jgi:hypothetical protein
MQRAFFMALASSVFVVFATRIQRDALHVFPPKEAWFTSPVDHFSFTSNATFNLRYLVYDEWFGSQGSRKSVLFYCGNEADIYSFYDATGLMFDIASEIGALLVFAEHR